MNGTLPRDLGWNLPLIVVDVSGNEFSGEIPDGLCEKGVLEELLIIDNKFSRKISASFCRSLLRVRPIGNGLSGEFLGLAACVSTRASREFVLREISPVIASATNMSLLLISDNQFSGGIPAEIGSLQTLVEFSGSGNRLSGSIPKTIGKLELLGRLDLHNNELSGEIPAEILSCKKLSELNLAENELSGQIPPEIGYLPVLSYLDFSENRLTGEIPIELQNLKLDRFNLSSNRLSGKLPPMYAKEMYRESFLWNPGLCGGLQELCSESQRGETKSHRLLWLLRSIFILAGLVLVVGVGWFYWSYQNFKKVKKGTDKSKWTLESRKPLAVLATSGVDLSYM